MKRMYVLLLTVIMLAIASMSTPDMTANEAKYLTESIGTIHRVEAATYSRVVYKNGRYYKGKSLYTGYYKGTNGLLYHITKGKASLKTGTVPACTYYEAKGKVWVTAYSNVVYVKGKVYSGYYRSSTGKLYRVQSGFRILQNGILKAKTKYYNYNSKKYVKLSANTVYISGKLYSGYYRSNNNILYTVKNGKPTKKSGTVPAWTKYNKTNSYITQSNDIVYVKGKVYSGYYRSSAGKLYHVKSGIRTLKTGTVAAKTKYYDYNSKKYVKLSTDTIYIVGKAYTGYYMDSDGYLYSVKSGKSSKVNGKLSAGTKYYNTNIEKYVTLLRDASYKNGATEIYRKLMELKKQYPEGTKWDTSQTYAYQRNGYYEDRVVIQINGGCASFAYRISDALYGTKAYEKTIRTNLKEVQPGDIICTRSRGHSMVVIDTDSNGITVCEGNYGGTVHWGRRFTWTAVNGFDYYIRRYK